MNPKILVIGGLGKIGKKLIPELYKHYTLKNMLITDKIPINSEIRENIHGYMQLNGADSARMAALVQRNKINVIMNFAYVNPTREKNLLNSVNRKINANILNISRKMNITYFSFFMNFNKIKLCFNFINFCKS